MTIGDCGHTCRAPGCTRFAQLHSASGMCVSHHTNWHKDRTSDGRSTGVAKITPEQVTEARRMRAAFKSNREIAKHFGVSVATLRKHMNRS